MRHEQTEAESNISILLTRNLPIDSLKLDAQGQGRRNILDVDAHWGWAVLKFRQFSWTSYVYRPLAVFILRITCRDSLLRQPPYIETIK